MDELDVVLASGPIGIMDSGIGGIGIWQSIINRLPNEDIVYFADSANSPYGSKGKDEIINLSHRIVKYLRLEHKIKLLVVACNTATVSAISYLREQFPYMGVVGVVPVIKPACKSSKTKEVLCLATDRTVESEAQNELIKEHGKSNGVRVYNVACRGLVELIEGGLKGKDNELKKKLKEYINPYKEHAIDTVVLGCTHYTLIENIIREILPWKGGAEGGAEGGEKVKILNSNEAISRQVARVLNERDILRGRGRGLVGEYKFVINGDIGITQKVLEEYIGHKVKVISYVESTGTA